MEASLELPHELTFRVVRWALGEGAKAKFLDASLRGAEETTHLVLALSTAGESGSELLLGVLVD